VTILEQQLGRAVQQPFPLRGRHGVANGRRDERMGELGCLGGAQQTHGRQSRGGLDAVARIQTCDLGEPRDRPEVADHGRRLDQGARGGVEATQSADHVATDGARADLPQPLRRQVAARQSLLMQRLGERGQRVGVAVGLCVAGIAQLDGKLDAQLRADQEPSRHLAEQRGPRDHGPAVVEELEQWSAIEPWVAAANRERDAGGGPAGSLGEQQQPAQGGGVRPLHVVDADDERRSVGEIEHRGDAAREQAGDLLGRPVVRLRPALAERGSRDLEGDLRSDLAALGRQPADAARGGAPARGLQHRRLADPGRALEHQPPTTARSDAAQKRLDGGQLQLAFEQAGSR
jgi:hypothetical protein